MSKTVDKNVNYSQFEKKFIDTLITKNTELFSGNQKAHVSTFQCYHD